MVDMLPSLPQLDIASFDDDDGSSKKRRDGGITIQNYCPDRKKLKTTTWPTPRKSSFRPVQASSAVASSSPRGHSEFDDDEEEVMQLQITATLTNDNETGYCIEQNDGFSTPRMNNSIVSASIRTLAPFPFLSPFDDATSSPHLSSPCITLKPKFHRRFNSCRRILFPPDAMKIDDEDGSSSTDGTSSSNEAIYS